MYRIILRLGFIFMLSVSISGCAAISGKSSSGELEEAEDAYAIGTLAVNAKLRFSDLPVPAGFRLLKDKSFVFQTEDTRVALLKYAGRAKTQDLIDFYKQQMLLYNWELLNVVEYGRSVLNFERGGQSCIVTIEPRAMKKIVTIALSPRAKGSMETEVSK